MMNQIYPRPHDKQTVYLKDIVTGPNIEVGDYTIPAIQSGNLAALEDVEGSRPSLTRKQHPAPKPMISG